MFFLRSACHDKKIVVYPELAGKASANSPQGPMFDNWKLWLWIAGSGGVGAVLRVAITQACERGLGTSTQVGVLAVNLLGSAGVGLALGVGLTGGIRTVVLAGFLGGFTTFGAVTGFALEMLERGAFGLLLAQLALHLVGGVALLWLARAFGQWLLSFA